MSAEDVFLERWLSYVESTKDDLRDFVDEANARGVLGPLRAAKVRMRTSFVTAELDKLHARIQAEWARRRSKAGAA